MLSSEPPYRVTRQLVNQSVARKVFCTAWVEVTQASPFKGWSLAAFISLFDNSKELFIACLL